MKYIPFSKIIFFSSLVFLFFSCVSPRQFTALQKENNDCQSERELLRNENEKLTVDNTELTSRLGVLQKEKDKWGKDSLKRMEEIARLQNENNQLDKRYEDLRKAQESLVEGSTSETKKLLSQLQTTQDNLYKKEDDLNNLSARLETERKNLDNLKQQLESRNARLIELEGILSRKDSAVVALKNKVSNALLGFEGKGLKVTQKNGKVYVSLEEKLLFPSGSTDVDPNGVNALKQLARVLEQNPDINITIEGHTDDVPVIPGSKYKDNWDLSVQRATSIVRILLDGTNIDPKRLTAAGRSQYLPVDPAKTPEARQKNRRTEIILTPNLDELFKILDSNN